MPKFKAIRIDKSDAGQSVGIVEFDEAELMEGSVDVRISHSTVNYKDGLAITGKSPVVRRFPMIPGIDFAGTVERSSHPAYAPGDQVVLVTTGGRTRINHAPGFAPEPMPAQPTYPSQPVPRS